MVHKDSTNWYKVVDKVQIKNPYFKKLKSDFLKIIFTDYLRRK
jgi:hypothetical protein